VKRAFLTATLLLVALGAAGVVWASRSTPYVRNRIVQALNEHFATNVHLATLQASVFPSPAIAGSELTLRYAGDEGRPPLIQLSAFSASAGVWGLIAHPMHLHDVTLDGLDIRIPPGGIDLSQQGTPRAGETVTRSPILIDKIVSRHARLEIPSHRPDRLPRVFNIDDLVIDGFGRPEGARFHAALANPMPRGRIDTTGIFGPWNRSTPERTAVRGQYVFKQAMLDDIKGIGGTLSSAGTYSGVLERLVVEGQTNTPDFHIDIAGAPVPLTTRFKATVDGTNGDTWLDLVEAQLGESTIIATGEVVRARDVQGRRVALDVRMTAARLEDLMRLAVKSPKPPLLGRVDLTTTFLLPAGEATVADRLQLDGQFAIVEARFTNFDVQRRITLLSQRGRGDDDGNGTGERVVSNVKGRFRLRNARLAFTHLTFGVPGSQVVLDGTYDLHSENIDFAGDLLMDASLADMTHGIKSVLARLAQPFFRRPGGGTRIPIRIAGSRSNPSFRLDVRRVFRRR
jgi:hypothetical protein